MSKAFELLILSVSRFLSLSFCFLTTQVRIDLFILFLNLPLKLLVVVK